MSITVAEKWDSREQSAGEEASVELAFIVRGTSDDIAAHEALLDQAPSTYSGLVRKSSHLERIAEDTWEGTIRYGRIDRPPGTSTLSFDTGGGTQHIAQSLATGGIHAAPGQVAPNFGGAIGVTHDSVEGVDITVPVFNFSETHILEFAAVTAPYIKTLASLTGSVNNAPFKGFAPGEVLFMGASGSTRENDEGEPEWEISYSFGASPNVAGLVVGDITGIEKRGWDYLWVRYADAVDGEAHVLVKKPIAVYVEKVYPDGNFAALNIGT